MIHTVTVNPALDLTYRIREVKFDDKLRAKAVFRAPGGNGINVSRVAVRLGEDTVAMGFLGGRTGDEIQDMLRQEGIRTWFTRQRTTTRTNVIIQDDTSQQIRVSGPGAEADPSEVQALRSSIFDLRSPDFLVFTGSLLKGMTSDFYRESILEANQLGIKVAADADRDDLKAAIEAGAYLIKPNQHELERLGGRPIRSDQDVIEVARGVLERGVRAVLASLGGDGALLVSEHEVWKAIPPNIKVDSVVGAGDSLLAGALVARAKGAGWPEMLRWGVACGTATATTPGTDLCHLDTIKEILPQIRLEHLT